MNQTYNGQNDAALVTPHRSRLAVGGRATLPKYKPIPSFTSEQIARFWSKVDKLAPGGCWMWKGKLCPNGYGAFLDFKVHRVAVTLMRGVVPPNKQLDHICRNRACVNPDHLEIVTNKQNALRGLSFSAINARKTHCRNGHDLPPANKWGKRQCRTCHIEYLRAKRRAAK